MRLFFIVRSISSLWSCPAGKPFQAGFGNNYIPPGAERQYPGRKKAAPWAADGQKTSPHPLLRRMGGSTIDRTIHWSSYLVLS